MDEHKIARFLDCCLLRQRRSKGIKCHLLQTFVKINRASAFPRA